MKVHHIGYLVKNIEKSRAEFKALGFIEESDPVYDPYRDIDICFLYKDSLRVELVCPSSDQSVVYSLQKKMGVTPYHICYQVDDFEKAASELRNRGYIPMGEAQMAPAINNVFAGFFFHREMGIIEIINAK